MRTTLRRQARITALQTLYEYDTAHHDVDTVLQRHMDERRLSSRVAEYAGELAHGVLEHLEAIDNTIQEVAPEWPIAQMARIDKNILRLAIYEILYNTAVPAKAAINEAVELAKLFGGDASSRFVNGVLGAIYTSSQLSERTPAAPETPAKGEVP